ncbi:MAG TPA: VCBS repeat-containing protein [Pyrinomonadaceae bacterium]|jgi:hypothetical protein
MKKYSSVLLLTIATILVWTITAAAAPANDNFANAQTVSFIGNTVEIDSNNVGATREVGEPDHFNNTDPGAKSVWYKWTPTSLFSVQIEVTENFNSLLTVYSTTSNNPGFGDLTRVGTRGDFQETGGTQVHVRFFPQTGKTYYIVIDCTRPSAPITEGNFQLKFMRNKLSYSTKHSWYGEGAAVTLYRPSEGNWYTTYNLNFPQTWTDLQWGSNGDKPVPADYDGDGSADVGVTRDMGGQKIWYLNYYNNIPPIYIQWGLGSDKSLTGDFDRDGRADLVALRNTAQGYVWYVRQSSDGAMRTFQFGQTGDQPVLGDFDGDGATDVAVVRLSGGALFWHILKSDYANQPLTYTKYEVVQFGNGSDAPAIEDFDGDGKTDFAVFRPQEGNWYILRSGTNELQVTAFGAQGDKPQPADYDGDGKADLAVYRPTDGNWYSWLSRTNTQKFIHFGISTDIPVSSMNAFLQ